VPLKQYIFMYYLFGAENEFGRKMFKLPAWWWCHTGVLQAKDEGSQGGVGATQKVAPTWGILPA
jgi:hypothetical protein